MCDLPIINVRVDHIAISKRDVWVQTVFYMQRLFGRSHCDINSDVAMWHALFGRSHRDITVTWLCRYWHRDVTYPLWWVPTLFGGYLPSLVGTDPLWWVPTLFGGYLPKTHLPKRVGHIAMSIADPLWVQTVFYIQRLFGRWHRDINELQICNTKVAHRYSDVTYPLW